MHPTYTINDKNVITIHGFKHYVALLFHKGAIIEDKYETLIQQTERVQATRQIRFKTLEEIKERRDEILYYINEAIEVEKDGKKVEMKKTEDYEIPEELQQAFNDNPNLEEAFYKLTPGRQINTYITFHKLSVVKQDKAELKNILIIFLMVKGCTINRFRMKEAFNQHR